MLRRMQLKTSANPGCEAHVEWVVIPLLWAIWRARRVGLSSSSSFQLFSALLSYSQLFSFGRFSPYPIIVLWDIIVCTWWWLVGSWAFKVVPSCCWTGPSDESNTAAGWMQGLRRCSSLAPGGNSHCQELVLVAWETRSWMAFFFSFCPVCQSFHWQVDIVRQALYISIAATQVYQPQVVGGRVWNKFEKIVLKTVSRE